MHTPSLIALSLVALASAQLPQYNHDGSSWNGNGNNGGGGGEDSWGNGSGQAGATATGGGGGGTATPTVAGQSSLPTSNTSFGPGVNGTTSGDSNPFSILSLPQCASSCVSSLLPSNCSVDPSCICHSTSFLLTAPCCLSNACTNQVDRETVVNFSKGLCAAVNVQLPDTLACRSSLPETATRTEPVFSFSAPDLFPTQQSSSSGSNTGGADSLAVRTRSVLAIVAAVIVGGLGFA